MLQVWLGLGITRLPAGTSAWLLLGATEGGGVAQSLLLPLLISA